jgi:predicted nuclease of predicted toxin-antitoxin system
VRLLLDEDSGSHSLLNSLREARHDVERVVDISALGAGTTDAAVFAYAITNDRVLITKNGADFIALAEREHPSVFVLHYGRDGSNFGGATVVRAITNIAATYESIRNLFLDINQHVW